LRNEDPRGLPLFVIEPTIAILIEPRDQFAFRSHRATRPTGTERRRPVQLARNISRRNIFGRLCCCDTHVQSDHQHQARRNDDKLGVLRMAMELTDKALEWALYDLVLGWRR